MKYTTFLMVFSLVFNFKSIELIHSTGNSEKEGETKQVLYFSDKSHQKLMHSENTIQESKRIIQDVQLSEIIGGGSFMEGFCLGMTIGGVAAYFFPPLAVPVTVGGGICALWGIYGLFN